MSDGTNNDNSFLEQPHRPVRRGSRRYAILNEATTAPQKSAPAFTLTVTATPKEGGTMDDGSRFMLQIIFKPNESGLRLRPAETQLLLSYWSEILKEIEEEEKHSTETELTIANAESVVPEKEP